MIKSLNKEESCTLLLCAQMREERILQWIRQGEQFKTAENPKSEQQQRCVISMSVCLSAEFPAGPT